MLPVTALYGALLTAMVCALAIRTATRRQGRLQEEELHRRSRAHSNLAENAPLFVLGMALVELGGGSLWGLHLCGAAFVLARLSHAVALSQSYGPSQGRKLGIIATWLLLAAVWTWAALASWGLAP